MKISSKTRLTEKQRANLPDDACELVDAIRKEKRQEDRNKERRISRLEDLLEKGSEFAEKEDVGTFASIIEKALPHAKDTMEAEVFRQSLLMLRTKAGKPKARPMYHDAVIKYALSLLSQVNKKTYESLAQILALPTHRHARKLKKQLVDAEGVAVDGPRRRMNRQMREVAIENKWMRKQGFLDIGLSFDSMGIG